MITANQAKQLTIQSFASELEDIELEIREAAKRGLASIKLSTGLWSKENIHGKKAIVLTGIIKSMGYSINYDTGYKEEVEISW